MLVVSRRRVLLGVPLLGYTMQKALGVASLLRNRAFVMP